MDDDVAGISDDVRMVDDGASGKDGTGLDDVRMGKDGGVLGLDRKLFLTTAPTVPGLGSLPTSDKDLSLARDKSIFINTTIIYKHIMIILLLCHLVPQNTKYN